MDQFLPVACDGFSAFSAVVRPRILILSFSGIRSDPRVMRQVRLLEHEADLTVAGYGPAPDAACEYVQIPKERSGLGRKLLWSATLLIGAFESYLWRRPEVVSAVGLLSGHRFDVIIANDISSLPAALRIAAGAPVLADAHEFSPREFDDRLMWRLLFRKYQDYLCREYLPRASAMTTVCQGIADAYQQSYGVKAQIVFNAPRFEDRSPSPVIPGRVRLVHHGATIRSRHLGQMIELMALLDDRFTLDFMLVESDKAYGKELREQAAADMRIRFRQPVRMEEIASRINEYDVGLYLLPPVNFNHEYALPNKLFEFIQARLAIAIGPSTEMSRIVKQYSLGVVADSFDPAALADKLLALTDEGLQQFKRAAHDAARVLSYESSGAVLEEVLRSLLEREKS